MHIYASLFKRELSLLICKQYGNANSLFCCCPAKVSFYFLFCVLHYTGLLLYILSLWGIIT